MLFSKKAEQFLNLRMQRIYFGLIICSFWENCRGIFTLISIRRVLPWFQTLLEECGINSLMEQCFLSKRIPSR